MIFKLGNNDNYFPQFFIEDKPLKKRKTIMSSN